MNTEKNKKILIIEDNEFLGDILEVKLSKVGYDVTWEKDGQAGLEKIRELMPDLVLLDIVLPKMNGYEVLEACSQDKILKQVPVIIISNSGEPVEIQRVLQLGAKDYLVKADFNPDEVLEKVEKELHGEEESDEAEAVEEEAEGDPETDDAKVLVVEDDEFLRSLMGKKLSTKMHNIFYAADGEDALEIAEKEVPQLILLDLIMPGMGGFEVLERLKANPKLKDIPVIILSNLGGEEKEQKGKELGAVDFLVKANFSIDEIIEKMREYVAVPE